ncbi:hypothetical protein ES706_01683 [subsurface metagenome]
MEEDKLRLIKEPLRTSFRQLIDRCEKAGIEHDLEHLLDEDYYLKIYLPSGRDKRTIVAFDLEDIQKLNQVEFEKYVFIQGYESICSYEYASIETYIKPLRPFSRQLLFSRLLNISYDDIRNMKKEDLVFEVKHQVDDGNVIIITISQPTNTMLVLAGRELGERSDLTIKIKGLKISNNEEAAAISEKLANSLFFQILNSVGIPLMLEPYREPRAFRDSVFVAQKDIKYPIPFPRYQYAVDPLNLYWYATSAYAIPLLQFLAYYQVLEFYFPIYSRQEVQAEVANIVKDPRFNPDHPIDINKVISAVSSKLGRGYIDEKGQLRITIKACVQDTEVRELIERDDATKKYFRDDYKKLSRIKVSIDNKDLDLREQLADRLYDIRCRIVHTKADEIQKERILPFTREETLLQDEVSIIAFIARRALIAGSKRLGL